MDDANRPQPRSRGIYLLPNLLTTGGMFSGFYAILAAASGHFENACIAVFVAALFDGVDGRIARLTGTNTEFGVQYDSLADLVSFGMAPALVMYHWSLMSLKLVGPNWGKLGWAVAFLYAACAALRLARFNTQVGSVDKRYFIGLASPAAAAMMVSFVWVCTANGYSGDQMRAVAPVVTTLAALLMVSRFRYYSFKALPWGERVPFIVFPLVLGVFVALAVDPPVVLFAISAIYLLSAPVGSLLGRLRRKRVPG